MKKIATILVSIIISLNITAQGVTNIDDSKKKQINIGYFNAFKLSSINDFGIGYKHTFKNSALRFGSTFYYNSQEQGYDNNNYSYISKSLRVRPRIGYEFHQNYNKLQLLYGFDLTGIIEDYNRTRENGQDDDYLHESNTYGAGISPIIGLKYQINKTISITTETSFDVMFTQSETYNKSNDHESTNITNESFAKLNPLGVFSINIHF